jgi:hypothetical protein
MLKPEIQSLVPIILSRFLIILVRTPLLQRHGRPCSFLLLVEVDEVPALHDECHEGETADCNQNCVAAVVVWCIIGAVDLGADHGTNLHDHVVGCRCDGALLYIERVFGDPGGDNGVEVRVYIRMVSIFCGG